VLDRQHEVLQAREAVLDGAVRQAERG